MGKYMKKSNLKGEVTAMELTQSSLGVRTRAKTLALQRLQNTTLRRSRRLENRPTDHPKENSNPNPNSRPISRLGAVGSAGSGSAGSAELSCSRGEGKEGALKAEEETVLQSLEASFGENFFGIEGGRSTRETTPCSLIAGSDTVGTPGSATRVTGSSATNRRRQNTTRRTIPLAHEMDEFFTGAEQQQQRVFTEKYNFDPVNESPLPGRYDWERVNP